MSRELDARVAEAMPDGFVWEGHFTDMTGERVMTCDNGRVALHLALERGGRAVAVPKPYSTDPAACNELRAECRRRGWCYEEAWYAAADGSDAEFWTWVNDFDLHHISEVSQEEAFCLAFLAAVEAEKGAKQ